MCTYLEAGNISFSENVVYVLHGCNPIIIWNKVFNNGPGQICGRQTLKNLKGFGLLKKYDLLWRTAVGLMVVL